MVYCRYCFGFNHKPSSDSPFQTLALFAVAFGLALPAGSQQFYNITDLGYPYDSYSEAHAISASGSVVGEYQLTNNLFNVYAFLYQNGARNKLGVQPAAAYGINATDQVVGERYVGTSSEAFEWTNGTMIGLGALSGAVPPGYSSAQAINRSGQIAGASTTGFGLSLPTHAVLWSNSGARDLGTLVGSSGYSFAYGINLAGVIVGETDVVPSGSANTFNHAFIYTNNTMQELGTLPGTNDYSAAFGINDSGVIVGESDTLVGGVAATHAFIYRNGAMSDLGTLGGAFSSASAINSAGQVVGYAADSNGVSCAFLYDGSTLMNLNDLIPPGSGFTNLASGDAISDAGQIAGSGYLADGSYHAFLLTPAGPLLLAITNPAGHQIFFAPATFPISVYVSDSAGTVTNVQFLVNSTVIGNATVSPYSATATDLSAGNYTLTAIAADNIGITQTNSISISVTNGALGPIQLLNPVFSSGSFAFSFNTQSGATYYGQYTTRLSNTVAASNNWLTFTSLVGNGSAVWVTNSPLTNAQGFYRVVAH